MINRNKLEHILEYARQQRHIGQSCKVPPEDMVEIMERLLNAGNSPVIPEGYVMVPKEPTEAMINAWLSEVANWRGHVAGYKAMLAAAPQPQNAPQNIPEIIPGWIPVSERMPEVGDIVLTAMGGVVNVGETECSAANCRFFTSVISGRELPATHWMPLPAAPQEVKCWRTSS